MNGLGKHFMIDKKAIQESINRHYERIDSKTLDAIESHIISPSEPNFLGLTEWAFGFSSKQALNIIKQCTQVGDVDVVKLKLIKMLSAKRTSQPAINRDHLSMHAQGHLTSLKRQKGFVPSNSHIKFWIYLDVVTVTRG